MYITMTQLPCMHAFHMYLSKGQGKVLRSKIYGMEPTNSMHGVQLTDEQNTTKYIEEHACINRQQATLHVIT